MDLETKPIKIKSKKATKLNKQKLQDPSGPISNPNLDSLSEQDNNNENNGHPRNRWRCMQPRLCNYCWKTFSNSFNLKQHIVNVHIQSQGVSCSLCDKVVKNKWYLRKHLVTAHGAPLKRVTAKNATKENGDSSNAGCKPGESIPVEPNETSLDNSETNVNHNANLRLSTSTTC